MKKTRSKKSRDTVPLNNSSRLDEHQTCTGDLGKLSKSVQADALFFPATFGMSFFQEWISYQHGPQP
jgi:hypothetical protein